MKTQATFTLDHTLYADTCKKYPLLSAAAEQALSIRIINGDRNAVDVLVLSNVRLVHTIVLKYVNLGIPYADLIQEGVEGLIKAALRFDGSLGFRFSTYSGRWICQSILDALEKSSRTISLNGAGTDHYRRILEAQAKILNDENRVASNEEIAEILGLDVSLVNDVLNAVHSASLNENLGEDNYDDYTRESKLPCEDVFQCLIDNEALKIDLERVMNTLLDKRAIYIVKHLFGIDCGKEQNAREIAEDLALSRERVRQIAEQALKTIRDSDKARRLLYRYCA